MSNLPIIYDDAGQAEWTAARWNNAIRYGTAFVVWLFDGGHAVEVKDETYKHLGYI